MVYYPDAPRTPSPLSQDNLIKEGEKPQIGQRVGKCTNRESPEKIPGSPWIFPVFSVEAAITLAVIYITW
jgi:hypothetical protein